MKSILIDETLSFNEIYYSELINKMYNKNSLEFMTWYVEKYSDAVSELINKIHEMEITDDRFPFFEKDLKDAYSKLCTIRSVLHTSNDKRLQDKNIKTCFKYADEEYKAYMLGLQTEYEE